MARLSQLKCSSLQSGVAGIFAFV